MQITHNIKTINTTFTLISALIEINYRNVIVSIEQFALYWVDNSFVFRFGLVFISHQLKQWFSLFFCWKDKINKSERKNEQTHTLQNIFITETIYTANELKNKSVNRQETKNSKIADRTCCKNCGSVKYTIWIKKYSFKIHSNVYSFNEKKKTNQSHLLLHVMEKLTVMTSC